jgi:hypothetical protein
MKLKAVKRAGNAERLKGIAVEVAVRPDSIAIETRFAPEKGLSSIGRARTSRRLLTF